MRSEFNENSGSFCVDEVIAGFIGRRFDYTLLGDAVDLADYCMNAAQSNEVFTTEATFASLVDKVNVSSKGTKTFQGNPVKLFEITSKKSSSPPEKGLPSLPSSLSCHKSKLD